jgi:hypothetical protein
MNEDVKERKRQLARHERQAEQAERAMQLETRPLVPGA